MKEELVINGAAMNIELYGIESQILKLLSESEGNILDNTALIETLAEAKVCGENTQGYFPLHQQLEYTGFQSVEASTCAVRMAM